MKLLSLTLLVAFAALSSGRRLSNQFRQNSDCFDELETIRENVCTPITHQECEYKPEEKCNTIIHPECKNVDEQVCENREETVCHDVEKQECPPVKKSCSVVKDCHTITEKKCKTENIDHHQSGEHTIEKCWDEQREVCNPHETCKEVVQDCKTVQVPKCTTKTVPSCKTLTRNVCVEKTGQVCHFVDKQVCHDKTTQECQAIKKEKPTGRQCCTVITPETSRSCSIVKKPVEENVCHTQQDCHSIPERKCKIKTIDHNRPGVHTAEECWEEQREICNPREVCERVTKYKNEESCEEIVNNIPTITCE